MLSVYVSFRGLSPKVRTPKVGTLLQLHQSISRPRSRITWAITVPEDPEHSIYVWFDALTVYLSATGYPWTTPETETNKAVFPPNLQIIGKDILRYVAACTTDPHKG